jgi:hypothetical protein
MKQLVLLAGCAVFLMGIAGCQNAHTGVNVVIEGGGEFPQSLVGWWKADKNQWEFVFEPDGTISYAVIDSGFIKVKPSKRVHTVPTKKGGKAVYKLGTWTVQYSPDTRELAVEVVVDHLHIDMGPNWLEGTTRDWFVGTVSEDWQEWWAQWISFPKYIAYTPEPGELPVDPNDTITDLLFKKVAD